VLEVIFKHDTVRLGIGYGAINMAAIRHFVINLVGTHKGKTKVSSRDEGSLNGSSAISRQSPNQIKLTRS